MIPYLEAIELELQAVNTRRDFLLAELERLQNREANERAMRTAMVAAGFTTEAIESAMRLHFKEGTAVSNTSTEQTGSQVSKKPPTTDLLLTVKAHLDSEYKSSRQLQDQSGLDKVRLLRALNYLIESGQAEADGKLNGRKYRLHCA